MVRPHPVIHILMMIMMMIFIITMMIITMMMMMITMPLWYEMQCQNIPDELYGCPGRPSIIDYWPPKVPKGLILIQNHQTITQRIKKHHTKS